MKYIDLFAGIGGFHYGISLSGHPAHEKEAERQGLQVERELHFGWNGNPRCVYSNEWDKYANSVYRRHYGECDSRDITTVPNSDIPDHDLLCAGFPCQSFSVAGKRRGFNETRGTLFFEIARILDHKRPRYFLLENVKGLLSHDLGKTFQTMLRVLTELGYDCQWQVLNSKDFGVPQHRERIYIIGHLRGLPRPEVFPLSEGGGLHPEQKPKRQRQKSLSHALRAHSYDGQKVSGETYVLKELTKDVSDAQRIYDIKGIAKTLKGLGGGLGAKTGLYAHSDSYLVRRLTPKETERLQGFPDDWTKYGANGEIISDTQRYKMTGNAVTTTVVASIVRKMYEIRSS